MARSILCRCGLTLYNGLSWPSFELVYIFIMATYRTTDHEIIRNWILEHNGVPAVVRDTAGEEGDAEVLRLVFGNAGNELQRISWNEFFTIFDTRRLRFRYEDPIGQETPEWAFAFESIDQPRETVDDETELPEDVDNVEENMFPSA